MPSRHLSNCDLRLRSNSNTRRTTSRESHPWPSKDCSLYTNALVYNPPSAPHASPWPGLVGGTYASMTLVAGPPVPTSEVAFRALRTLREASLGTAAHRGDTERGELPLRTRLDSACAKLRTIGRRYRPVVPVLWLQELSRLRLAHQRTGAAERLDNRQHE